MPRKARIDAPGALHHIIVRGIERRKVFMDDDDRDGFIDRLGGILTETGTRCFAWALIPNHFHLLLQSGDVPIATVMRRLLTGHAVSFNRRHRRTGHLFQNRYKSILCQEDPYLLELVRYIHLNPLRARLVADPDELEAFHYCGHGTVLGNHEHHWQDAGEVLRRFGKRRETARQRYRQFVQKGVNQGRRKDLTGGGLIRSAGGWESVEALSAMDGHEKSDERILGSGEFVESILAEHQEALERRYALKAEGMSVDKVAERVAQILDMPVARVWSPGKQRELVRARSLLCCWAVRELGESMAAMARRLGISAVAVGYAVQRGEKIIAKEGMKLGS